MHKSLRLIVALAGVLLVVAVIAALAVFLFSRQGGTPAGTNSIGSAAGTEQPVPIETNSSEVPSNNVVSEAAGINAEDLETTAVYFVERFGSYSNHTDTVYQNIEELYIYMTDAMRTWAEDFVATERAKSSSAGDVSYYGITTRALAPQLVSFDDGAGTAEFIISTERRENKDDSSEPRIFYQDITVRFLKIDTLWRVDEARWKE